ncbi:MAG: hypothetical protein AB7O43_14950 [Hyphomicrobiaceae bacterium]
MRKNAKRDGRTIPPADPRNGQKEASQRASSEPTPDGNVVDGIEAAELETYLATLEGLDLTRPQKIQIICSMQQIMQSFVDRAFGDDPTQLACKAKNNPRKANKR